MRFGIEKNTHDGIYQCRYVLNNVTRKERPEFMSVDEAARQNRDKKLVEEIAELAEESDVNADCKIAVIFDMITNHDTMW